MNLSKVCDKVIEVSFYALFFLVPLIWLPLNSELFEFNKMMLVYLLTVVISGAWVLRSLQEKKFQLQRTPLDIPIALFLLANIASTIFSLDPHTSLFGYYGRWHGGLLSTISYIILYYALVTHTYRKQLLYYLATLFTSGLIISIYAILQHPNPIFRETIDGKTVFHGIDYDYWAVDVENRVFGTLGQPNWLAAFLSMLLLPLVSLLFIFKKFWQQSLVFLAIGVYYLAFTFTYSRGGLVGLLAGFLTFVVLFPIYKPTVIESLKAKIPLFDISQTLDKLKIFLIPIIAVAVLVFTVNQFFGNALERRGGLQTNAEAETTESVSRAPTQLETGGTQTAKIRTIVWTGALNIFAKSPILGSGVETFGYSYYLFRPVEHNQTLEWDYLYNKAHNEYLNFLSTTGALGFLSYIILVATFEILAIKTIVKSSFSNARLLSLGLLAGFNANVVQNFFGFSVVPTALLFFIFPAIFFVINNTLEKSFILEFNKRLGFLNNKTYNNTAKALTILLVIFGTGAVLAAWTADYFYNRSLSADTYQASIRHLRSAVKLNPLEPIYRAELSKNLSALASTIVPDEDSQFSNYITESREVITDVVAKHPNNTNLWLDKRTIDYNLSKVDPAQELELLKTAEKLKILAPTEASIQYDVGLVYLYLEKDKEAIQQLEKVVSLKNDYREAVMMLARSYIKINDTEPAIILLQDWLKKSPTDTEAENLLKTLLTS